MPRSRRPRFRPAALAALAAAGVLTAGAIGVTGPAVAQSRVAPSPLGGADRPMPPEVEAVSQGGVDQRVGVQLPLDTPLRDQNGDVVTLGDYFGGGKPVLIEFAYLDCPLLCPMVENGIIRGIQASGWVPGEQFNVLTISISPRDTAEESRERLASITDRLGGPDTELGAGAQDGWHLLTGRPVDIQALADAAGFGYAAVPQTVDYAHAAVILFASPSGTITRYLPGHQYPDKDFRMALVEASEGHQGSLFDMVLQLCYRFDDSTGRYTADALALMKFAGAVTVVTLASIISGMFFFERKRRLRLDAPPPDAD